MQDKDSIRGSINKRMNVVHRCIRTPNIVLSVRTYAWIINAILARIGERHIPLFQGLLSYIFPPFFFYRL